ncbi:MAG: response regulator, partial [Chloroflexia bacterium]|nr:response regulator [Chloroflexia bacterium]
FDLILSDVKMPVMNGFEFLDALRQIDPQVAERMIFVTGDTVSPLTYAEFKAGLYRFLAKPFTIEQLEQIIASALNLRSPF